MPSALSRIEIVQAAVMQAGRSAELYSHAKVLLNAILRDQALKNRYRQLRKNFDGSAVLSTGQNSLVIGDLGAGIETLSFAGSTAILSEYDPDDFAGRAGTYTASQSTRPNFFTLDVEESRLRFNAVADRNYALAGTYYRLPADIPVGAEGDESKLWYSNDLAIIQGLIAYIYQYTNDERELLQAQRFEKMDGEYRRGIAPMAGGTQRIRLSSKFTR